MTMSAFDFSAYLQSPTYSMEGSNVLALPKVQTPSSSLRDEFLNATRTSPGVDFTSMDSSSFPEWALPSVIQPPVLDQQSLPMGQAFQSEASNSSTPILENSSDNYYRSRLAAHHSSLMQHTLSHRLDTGVIGVSPIRGEASSQRQRGSNSAPSVPLSRVALLRQPAHPASMTIQERRKFVRAKTVTSTIPEQEGPAVQDNLGQDGSEQSNHSNASVVAPAPQIEPTTISRPLDTEVSMEDIAPKPSHSFSDFDLIGALLKVLQRPNPQIKLGPIDLSCSFTVSDAQHPDQALVHCSDTFCNLTGYTREEIIGRNCRFLQAPQGKVAKGSERLHTDQSAVQHFKKNCAQLKECQATLLNYRADGTPFVNLVTVIPITWGDSMEPVFMIGFQVDLVQHPDAVVSRTPDGMCLVNYRDSTGGHGSIAKQKEEEIKLVAKHRKEKEAKKEELRAQELADLIAGKSQEMSRWAQVLLDNSQDFVHVLSLRGIFLYVSPSVQRILGYKVEEMLGKSISEFCHPSDVVPVFRELKESTSNANVLVTARNHANFDGTVNPPTRGGAGQTGPQVNLTMRMKHKEGGFEWIENIGKMHLEQGKGRKVVISSGRLRPMSSLPWHEARQALNQKNPGFWSKVSKEGLILSTSGVVADVVAPDAGKANVCLTGKNICDVISEDALETFLSSLQRLDVKSIDHLISNGHGGQSTAVVSTLIPSSSGKAACPTFVYTKRAGGRDITSKVNTSANAGKDQTSDCVFAELSTSRSTSWVYELHQLKLANKRLQREVAARQQKLPDISSSSKRITASIPVKLQSVSTAFFESSESAGTASSTISLSSTISRSRTASDSDNASGSDSSAPTSHDGSGSETLATALRGKRSRS